MSSQATTGVDRLVLTATAAWPFPAGDRAPAALRAKLREALLDHLQSQGRAVVDRIPDWSTLTVSGPVCEIEGGRTWFAYSAHVATVPVRT